MIDLDYISNASRPSIVRSIIIHYTGALLFLLLIVGRFGQGQ